jgi:hypothetical protein
LKQTKKKYPVDREKEQDYRYVEYAVAVVHLEKTIKFMKEVECDSSHWEKILNHIRSEKKKEWQFEKPLAKLKARQRR